VHSASRAISFFDVKGEIETLFGPSWKYMGLAGTADNGRVPKYYHPGLSVQLVAEAATDIGTFGQLHPEICQEYKIKQPVWIAEISLQPLISKHNPASAEKIFHEIPRFPSIERDISLVVEKDVTYSNIESTIRKAGIKEIERIFPFDLYTSQ